MLPRIKEQKVNHKDNNSKSFTCFDFVAAYTVRVKLMCRTDDIVCVAQAN